MMSEIKRLSKEPIFWLTKNNKYKISEIVMHTYLSLLKLGKYEFHVDLSV